MAKKKRGPGRPSIDKGESKVICFRLAEENFDRLKKMAAKSRRGLSDMLRIIIEDALDSEK